MCATDGVMFEPKQNPIISSGVIMHHVHITTTFIHPETGFTGLSTVLVPCASYDEAKLIARNVWDQRNGGNAAPNGVSHDAIILGDPCT